MAASFDDSAQNDMVEQYYNTRTAKQPDKPEDIKEMSISGSTFVKIESTTEPM